MARKAKRQRQELAARLIIGRIECGNVPPDLAIPVLDPVWEPIRAIEGSFAIEHPRLNVRVPETLAELAVCAAMRGADVGIISHTKTVFRMALRKSMEWRALRFEHHALPDGSLYDLLYQGRIFSLGADQVGEIPFTRCDVLFAAGCQSIVRRLPSVRSGAYVLAGELADRGHWFYAWARSGVPRVILTGDDAVAAWPREAIAKPAPDDPLYDRLYHVRDVAPQVVRIRPTFWARQHLRVKTDRPRELLHPRQRAEAAAQWGEPIVTLELTQVQRRYLSLKARLPRANPGTLNGRALRPARKPHFLLLKYRQGGFTTIEQALSYMQAVTRPNTAVETLANTKTKTQLIFEMVKRFVEYDPEAPAIVADSKDRLEFSNGSSFTLSTAGSRASSRGLTRQKVHWSEVAWSCPGPKHNSLIDEQIQGIANSAQHGEIVLETTPNGLDRFAELYKGAKAGANDWIPLFLRWFDDPANRLASGLFVPEEIADTLSEKERDLIARHKLDCAQIAFRRSKHKAFGIFALQEYPEDDSSCFITSGLCRFDVERALDLLDRLPDPDPARRPVPGGWVARWKEPEPGARYALGADCAEGIPGADASGFGIVNIRTGEQVAAAHGYLGVDILANLIAEYHLKYNLCLIGVEDEKYGFAVLRKLAEKGISEPHYRGGPVYYSHRADDIRKAKPGWNTNETTRTVMIDDLARAFVEGSLIVHDRSMVDEMLTFRLQRAGKFAADSGRHDDAVMKWAIAWQIRQWTPPGGSISLV